MGRRDMGGGGGGRRGPVRRGDAKARDETSGAQAKLMHRVRGRWWEVGGRGRREEVGGRRWVVVGRWYKVGCGR